MTRKAPALSPTERVALFAVAMLALATRFPGMSVTSWGRSVAHNAGLAGSAGASEHLVWTAADVVWDAGSRPDAGLLDAAARSWGLKLLAEKDHDHFQLLDLVTA